jgi:hypothetical protein
MNYWLSNHLSRRSPFLILTYASQSALSVPLIDLLVGHFQFYSTSLTWARCLRVPLIIAASDKHWFQRQSDVKEGEIEWFHNEASLEDGVNVIQCGGYVERQLVPCRSIFADRFLLSRTGTSPDHRYYTGIGRWSRNSKAKSISAPASSCVRILRWSNPHSRGLPSNGPCQTW